MQIRNVAGIALIGTAVVLTIKEIREINRVERELRAKIQADAAEEIIAINHAAAVVVDRLRSGQRYSGIDEVMTDFVFETIIHHEQ